MAEAEGYDVILQKAVYINPNTTSPTGDQGPECRCCNW